MQTRWGSEASQQYVPVLSKHSSSILVSRQALQPSSSKRAIRQGDQIPFTPRWKEDPDVAPRHQWTCHRDIATLFKSIGHQARWPNTFLFCAHAVRARSSDGHKNVLSLIGYSHILENRWEGKLGVNGNEANNTNKTQTKTHNKRHPEDKVKLNAFRNPQAAQYCSAMPKQIQHRNVPRDSRSSRVYRWRTQARGWFTHVLVDEAAQGREPLR